VLKNLSNPISSNSEFFYDKTIQKAGSIKGEYRVEICPLFQEPPGPFFTQTVIGKHRHRRSRMPEIVKQYYLVENSEIVNTYSLGDILKFLQACSLKHVYFENSAL